MGSFILMQKLKILKDHFKRWNKEVFGRVEDRKRAALRKIAFSYKVEKQRTLNERGMEDKTEALEDLKNWVVMEEII